MVTGCDDRGAYDLDDSRANPKHNVASAEAPEARFDMTPIETWLQRGRMVNEAMDAYAGWHDQCSAAERAYRYWAAARGADADAWYVAYSVALDREERAAEHYAQAIRRVGSLAAAELGPIKKPATAGGRR
jgi:hypothetical protein